IFTPLLFGKIVCSVATDNLLASLTFTKAKNWRKINLGTLLKEAYISFVALNDFKALLNTKKKTVKQANQIIFNIGITNIFPIIHTNTKDNKINKGSLNNVILNKNPFLLKRKIDLSNNIHPTL